MARPVTAVFPGHVAPVNAELGERVPISLAHRLDLRAVPIALVAILGGWIASSMPPTVVVVGALAMVGLAAAVVVPVRVLAYVVIIATFVTYPKFPLASFNFRVEHLVVIVLLLALALRGGTRSVVRVAQHPASLLLAAFLGYSALISISQSPDPKVSFGVIGWMGISWIVMVTLAAAVPTAGQLERAGVYSAAAAASTAIFLYGLNRAGVTDFGMSYDFVTGDRALFGVALEQNILGSTAAIWCFIALTAGRRSQTAPYRFAVLVTAVTLALTLTRAAIIGFAVAVLTVLVLGSVRVRRRVLTGIAVLVVVLAVLVVVAPSAISPLVVKYSPSNLVNTSASTGAYRIGVFEVAQKDITVESVFVGLGTNSYGQRHLDPTKPGAGGYLPSLPLQLLYDTGLVGLILIIAAVAELHPIRLLPKGRGLALLLLYIVTSMTTSQFWFGTTWMLFAWLLLLGYEADNKVGVAGGLGRIAGSSTVGRSSSTVA